MKRKSLMLALGFLLSGTGFYNTHAFLEETVDIMEISVELKGVKDLSETVTGTLENTLDETLEVTEETVDSVATVLPLAPKQSEYSIFDSLEPSPASDVPPAYLTSTPAVSESKVKAGKVMADKNTSEENEQNTLESAEDDMVVAALAAKNTPPDDIVSKKISGFNLGILLLLLFSFIAVALGVITPNMPYLLLHTTHSHKRIALVFGGLTALLFVLAILIV